MASDSSLADADVPTLAKAAENFLASQSWCGRVQQVTAVFAIVGIVGVFRCSLLPRSPDADVMVWVIVGDLPPACIVHEPGDLWQDALTGYVSEMERWIEAVRAGTSLDNVIPVNVAPSRESADMLSSRLDLIRSRLLDVDPDSVKSDV